MNNTYNNVTSPCQVTHTTSVEDVCHGTSATNSR